MKLSEAAVFTNMCMIYNQDNDILVLNRKNPDWPGITFPGGHVEQGESFCESVIREVKEETGLDIICPILCGIKQFQTDDNERYVVLFFKTNQYSGTLTSSDEGEVFWIKRKNLKDYCLSVDFIDMISIFDTDYLSEFYYYKEKDEWQFKVL